MTREEAIQILSTRDWSGMLCGYTSGYSEALDMAIEALQAEPTHGRLIDVDALEKELSKRWDISDDQDFCNKEVWEALRNAQTVQSDRPHGEWIADTDDSCGGITLTCSECGEQFNFDDADEVLDFKEHAHFCPNCCADMRKENK